MTDRVQCLDGLRGSAALWVLVGHVAHLSLERPGRDFGRWLLRKPPIVNRA